MTTQITVQVPDELAQDLDAAATALNLSRAEVVRQAVADYLEDYYDASVATARLHNAADPVLDWDEVRRNLAYAN